MFFLLFSIFSINTSVASTFHEIGDAGELVSTAQGSPDAVVHDSIRGFLDFGDVDLYKISVTDYANFEVEMTASLTPDSNPIPWDGFAGLWLFDTSGNLITDDFIYDLIFSGPAFFNPLWSNGEYLLAVALFGIVPDSGFGLSSGWDKINSNIQQGSYTVSLTGAQVSQVPLPAAFWLFSAGLMTLVRSRRKVA